MRSITSRQSFFAVHGINDLHTQGPEPAHMTLNTADGMNLSTADLVDAHSDVIRSCDAQFRQFGGRQRFYGPLRTIKTFEDNALIKQTLSTPGSGSVLVVDGEASLRCALVGDVIAGLGQQHGWAGLIIWGVIRDSVAIGKLDIGLKALGTNPWRSAKKG